MGDKYDCGDCKIIFRDVMPYILLYTYRRFIGTFSAHRIQKLTVVRLVIVRYPSVHHLVYKSLTFSRVNPSHTAIQCFF